jgi:hypothetical protein
MTPQEGQEVDLVQLPAHVRHAEADTRLSTVMHKPAHGNADPAAPPGCPDPKDRRTESVPTRLLRPSDSRRKSALGQG